MACAAKAQSTGFDISQSVFDFESWATNTEFRIFILLCSLVARYQRHTSILTSYLLCCQMGVPQLRKQIFSPRIWIICFQISRVDRLHRFFFYMGMDYLFQFIDTMFGELKPSAAEDVPYSFSVQNNLFSDWYPSAPSEVDAVVSELDTFFHNI